MNNLEIQNIVNVFFPRLMVSEQFKSLLQFDRTLEPWAYYSEGFEFHFCQEKWVFKAWSDDDVFINSFWEFGMANGSGSTYAFWLNEGEASLINAPIVIFGDEGGVHVVANNFEFFLKLLTFDCEPMVDLDSVDYIKSDDFEPSEYSHKYNYWLQKKYNISPVKSVTCIVKQAQERHKQKLDLFMSKFISSI